MVKCPDGEWIGYILYYSRKKGVGGVINGAYARISSTDNPRQSKGYCFGVRVCVGAQYVNPPINLPYTPISNITHQMVK